MLAANKQFLDDNRLFVESYSQKDPPRKMGIADRERLLAIVRQEFDKGFTADLWCEECVKVFILNAYVMYDNFLENESSK